MDNYPDNFNKFSSQKYLLKKIVLLLFFNKFLLIFEA